MGRLGRVTMASRRVGCLPRPTPMRYLLPRSTVRRAKSVMVYTTSANIRSMRLKKMRPVTSSTATMPSEYQK